MEGRTQKIINMILLLILATMLVLGFKELNTFYEKETEDQELVHKVVQIPKPDQGLDPDDPFNRYIDFAALKQMNPDICGWIYIPDTKIDYPILIGKNDTKYLNYNYKGKYSELGSIFAYAETHLDSDPHICIFGHNVMSSQMFGGLKKYKDQEYADAHKKMYLYTPGRTKECTLVSAFTCTSDDPIFEVTTLGEDEQKNPELLKSLMERSILNTVSSDSDQIFSLSTCGSYNRTNRRFTVHFALEREKYVVD